MFMKPTARKPRCGYWRPTNRSACCSRISSCRADSTASSWQLWRALNAPISGCSLPPATRGMEIQVGRSSSPATSCSASPITGAIWRGPSPTLCVRRCQRKRGSAGEPQGPIENGAPGVIQTHDLCLRRANLSVTLAYPDLRFPTLSFDKILIHRPNSGHKATLLCDSTLRSFRSDGEFVVSFLGVCKNAEADQIHRRRGDAARKAVHHLVQ